MQVKAIDFLWWPFAPKCSQVAWLLWLLGRGKSASACITQSGSYFEEGLRAWIMHAGDIRWHTAQLFCHSSPVMWARCVDLLVLVVLRWHASSLERVAEVVF